jgi:hypothetical protein
VSWTKALGEQKKLTLTPGESAESPCYEVPYGASNMYGWTLFPHGKPRRYHERLFIHCSESCRIRFGRDILTSVKLFMRNVQKPRNPCMMNPDRMHLISEMPEPAAYLAKERTR